MKLRNKHIITVFFVFSAAFFTSNAKAELVTIAIEATVNYVSDSGNYLEGKITNGSIITGSYTYESTTADSSSEDPIVGDYWHYGLPCGASLTVGGFEFKTNPADVQFLVEIINDSTSGGLHDTYLWRSYSDLPLSNGTAVYETSWQLRYSNAAIFSSDALPTTAPVLSQWQTNELRLEGDRTFLIRAEVTNAALIPEPTTILLFGLGTMFLRKRL